MNKMKIAVVGLGIIGGSYCKAIKKYTDHYVIGINRSPLPLEKALKCGAIDKIGSADDLSDIDMVILGVYPVLLLTLSEKMVTKSRKVLLLQILQVLRQKSVMT